MEALAHSAPLQLPKSLKLQSGRLKIRLPKVLGGMVRATIPDSMPRRSLVQFVSLCPIILNVNHALGAEEPELIRTQKLASGVRIQDVVEGEGAEAREGNLVEVNYVCRRSNGYFVHSTVDQFSGESDPVILPLDENQIIKGLKEVLVGMKVGGKRRALIPPSAGYINENLKPIPDEGIKRSERFTKQLSIGDFKFAFWEISYVLCGLIIGSFFAIKGPKNQFVHMTSQERLPFTLGFICTMAGTIYVSMVLHNYILSVVFAVLQVVALAYYAISYFPGGSTGMKFIFSGATSSILKCFGQ